MHALSKAVWDSPEGGFEKLEELGAVREVPGAERSRAVADLYREMTTDPARRILFVAPSHAEIERVTEAIRTDRSERGLLGQSVTMERLIPLQWTEAQKRDLSNYYEGQILQIHRPARAWRSTRRSRSIASNLITSSLATCTAKKEPLHQARPVVSPSPLAIALERSCERRLNW
jgi:hypothetical protein